MSKNIICNCFDVSKEEIVEAIKKEEITMVQEVIDETGAGGGCGGCHQDIQDIIDEVNS